MKKLAYLLKPRRLPLLSTVVCLMVLSGAANSIFGQAVDSSARTAPTSTPSPAGVKPSAAFGRVWIEYDVKEDGVIGMVIHVKFTTYAMKDLESYLAIYFKDSKGNYLRDRNGKYNSTMDDVAVYKLLKPGYDPAEYADYKVFMPYAEFDLPDGKYDLTMDIKLIYKAGGLIQMLTSHDFVYSQTGSKETDGRKRTPGI